MSEAVFLELQRIDSVQPLLRELLAQDGSAAWVGDLQSKGIILLVKTPPEELYVVNTDDATDVARTARIRAG